MDSRAESSRLFIEMAGAPASARLPTVAVGSDDSVSSASETVPSKRPAASMTGAPGTSAAVQSARASDTDVDVGSTSRGGVMARAVGMVANSGSPAMMRWASESDRLRIWLR